MTNLDIAVFTAALMVCGGMLCARHSHRVNAETVVAEGRLNLVRAADALENLDNSNPLVKRCVKYIRYLSELQDYRCKWPTIMLSKVICSLLFPQLIPTSTMSHPRKWACLVKWKASISWEWWICSMTTADLARIWLLSCLILPCLIR